MEPKKVVNYGSTLAVGIDVATFTESKATYAPTDNQKYHRLCAAWSLEKIVDTKPATTVVPSTLSIIPRQQACSWTFANELHLFGGLRHGIGLGDLLVFDLGQYITFSATYYQSFLIWTNTPTQWDFVDKKEVVFHQEEYTESEWPPIRPQARYGASCVLLGDVGYMMGGATDPRETAHDSWLYLPGKSYTHS